MLLLQVILFLLVVEKSFGQELSNGECGPVINYYSQNGNTGQQIGEKPVVSAGPPGKRGPPGQNGTPGPKGDRGIAGVKVSTCFFITLNTHRDIISSIQLL